MENANKHIPILDGIRAYAVLMVCVVHFFLINEKALYDTNRTLGIFLSKIAQLGFKGVELFFILSGFLITGILLDSKMSKKYFTTFYARRFLRIFPLYYLVLFFSFVIFPRIAIIDPEGGKIINDQIWLWTYTSNISWYWGHGNWDGSRNFFSFGHFWSLSVEEHFYLIWPLLIYSLKDKWIPRMMWFITFASFFSVLFVLFFGSVFPILQWTTIRCAGVLSIGSLIAWYRRNPTKFNEISVKARRYVLFLGILFIIFTFIPRKYQVQDVLTFFSSVAFFACLLTVSLTENQTTNKLFKHKSLFFIGKISYGIYVYHGLLRHFFKNNIYDGFLSEIPNGIISCSLYTLICTAISIFIAWLSWILFESTILKLKKHFTY